MITSVVYKVLSGICLSKSMFDNAVFKLIHSKVCITSQYKNITLWSGGLIKARKQMGLVKIIE